MPTRPDAYRPGRRNLLCALDWGLGHAARSLALAARLRAGGEEVIWASSGPARAFLRAELSGTAIYELPSYRVRYPSGNMAWNVARQLPGWLQTIGREYRTVRQLIGECGVDRVISDSRFGCFSGRVPSIFLTHQLHPITGNPFVSRIYRWHLQRFNACWVPDHPGSPLSGELSAARGYREVHYIGPLSRFSGGTTPGNSRWQTLSLLSGPEPMRSRLETLLRRVLADQPGPHLIVRGRPNGAPVLTERGITTYSFLTADELGRHLLAARTIICRSGYSTLMDLDALGFRGNLLLVPTPGQTEQTYLAQRLAEHPGSYAAVRVVDQQSLTTMAFE